MATSRPYRPNLDYESGGTAPQYWVDAPVTASSALPTTLGQNYQTYVFGNLPSTSTTTTMSYPQYYQPQSNVQFTQEQLYAFNRLVRDTLIYGTGLSTWKPAEPPKPLKTRPLTAQERAELDREMPF